MDGYKWSNKVARKVTRLDTSGLLSMGSCEKTESIKLPRPTREDLENRVKNTSAEIRPVQLNNVVSGTINRIHQVSTG